MRRTLSRLWGAYRWFRVACYVGGALSGTSLGSALVWLAYRFRRLGELATDSPEYASDQRLLPAPHMPDLSSWARPALAALAVLAALLVVRALLRWPMRKPDNPFDRDPRRLFTDSDRAWIDSCCQGRCEHRCLFGLFRCRYKAQQLDHWYPYAKGGATSRRNLVDLCARHNNRKSDHVPTRLQTAMLAHARLKYFPPEWRGYCRPDGLVDDPDRDATDEA